jgi:hypothetical protein
MRAAIVGGGVTSGIVEAAIGVAPPIGKAMLSATLHPPRDCRKCRKKHAANS